MQNPSVIRHNSRTSTAAQAKELSWSFILLVLVCACVVATGFFFAARQHFTSMDYGIKNSKLREQLRNLESEKRRLMLAREVASSPLAIRKAAFGLGFRNSGEVAAIPVVAKSEPTRESQPAVVQTKTSDSKRESVAIVRTVMTMPTSESSPNGATRSRIVDAKKDKKEKTEVAALLKLK
jgi:hypothetical protein